MNNPTDQKLILITNDDGYTAQGIHELTQLMAPLGEVVVVAPDSARSGAGCSITPTLPVTLRLVEEREGVTVYSCSGTPVDCIKLATEQCVPGTPDLIVSGINHGENASVSLHYSGTMGAVIEGCIKGIPSIGYSLRTLSKECDFSPYREVVRRVAEQVLQHGLPELTCLNVNFPEVEVLKGTKVGRMARGLWTGEWTEANHPHGQQCYWLTGQFNNLEPEADDTDYWALDHGYAAVTPIHLDMTNHAYLNTLKQALE